ncbi:MAG: hypothetical protein SGILL_001638, partial [Bacillariaceae sp.]
RQNQHPQQQQQQQQVDFLNRTMLFRLLLESKFGAATQRLDEHPEEAETWMVIQEDIPRTSTWIHHKRQRQRRRESWPSKLQMDDDNNNDDDTNALGQLPLHLAGTMLSPDSNSDDDDNDEKSALEEVITKLVSVYPEACRQRGRDGRLPLHHVLGCRSSVELVVQMIAANPDAVMDERNRALLNVGTSQDPEYANQIEMLLQHGEQALLRSRQDASLWFLLGVQGLGLQDDNSRRVANAVSLFQSAYVRLDLQQMRQDNSAEAAMELHDDGDIHSFEPLIKNLLARNAAYADVLLALARERIEKDGTTVILPQRTQRNTDEQHYAIQDENSYLKKRIFGLEMTLRDLGLNNKNGDDFSPHMENGEMMSVMGMDPEKPSALTKYMESKVTELQEEMDGLENENERLVAQVEEMQSLVNNLERKSSLGSDLNIGEDVRSVPSKLLSANSSDERNDALISAVIVHDTPASTPTSSDNGSKHDETPVPHHGREEKSNAEEEADMEKLDKAESTNHDELVEENQRLETEIKSLTNRVQELEEVIDGRSEAISGDGGSLEVSSTNAVGSCDENDRFFLENERLRRRVQELKKALDESARVHQSVGEGESLSATIDSLSAAVESHSAEVDGLHKQLEEISDEAVRKEETLKQVIVALQQQLAKTQKENREVHDRKDEPVAIRRSSIGSSKVEGSTSMESSKMEVSSDSFSTDRTDNSALLGEKLRVIDRISGHGNEGVEDEEEEISCSTPSSDSSDARSLDLSSAVTSPHSLYGSEQMDSKTSSSYTRSYNNSTSSGKSVSNSQAEREKEDDQGN